MKKYKKIYNEANFDIIDIKRVEWFIKEAKKQRNLDIDEISPVLDTLESLKYIKKNQLTNASILLFGKSPQKIFLQSIVKAIRFKGNDVTEYMIDFKTFEGDIFSQFEKLESFIFQHIPKKAWIENGKLQRQEKWLYPPKALREALANAFAHRNYNTTEANQVRIFDDRLEVWNPGSLPQGLTVDKLKRKHSSIPKNPLIARSFFWVKYAEEVGTGTNKIVKWCKEWKLPEPDFEEIGTSFVVTFKTIFSYDYLNTLNLNERHKKAIEYLRENQYITNTEYRKINNIGKVLASKELNHMVEKSLLKRIGSGRSIKYIINE